MIFFCVWKFFLCMFSSVSMLKHQHVRLMFLIFHLLLSNEFSNKLKENLFLFCFLPFPKSPFALQMLGRLIVTQILWQISNLLVFPVEMKKKITFYIFWWNNLMIRSWKSFMFAWMSFLAELEILRFYERFFFCASV